jgi:hypothetical protein
MLKLLHFFYIVYWEPSVYYSGPIGSLNFKVSLILEDPSVDPILGIMAGSYYIL